jgi:hypothetical protein
VEGNIASGKSTILEYLRTNLEFADFLQSSQSSICDINNENYEPSFLKNEKSIKMNSQKQPIIKVNVLPEPVDLWCNLNGNNLLDLMYKDPERWTFAFHSYVQITMLENHLKASECNQATATPTSAMAFSLSESPAGAMFNFSGQSNITPLKSNNNTNSPVKQHYNKDNNNEYHINILERSLYSARYCFVENLYRQ